MSQEDACDKWYSQKIHLEKCKSQNVDLWAICSQNLVRAHRMLLGPQKCWFISYFGLQITQKKQIWQKQQQRQMRAPSSLIPSAKWPLKLFTYFDHWKNVFVCIHASILHFLISLMKRQYGCTLACNQLLGPWDSITTQVNLLKNRKDT